MIGRLLDRLPRMPLPEFYGVYWAARRPRQDSSRIDQLVAVAFLVELLALAGIAVVAGLGRGTPGALAWCLLLWLVAGAADVMSSLADSKLGRMTGYVGVNASLRALVRSLFALAALAVAGNGAGAMAYLVVVAVLHLCWAVMTTLARWLAGLQAPLMYDPAAGRQGERFLDYAGIYAVAVGTPPALVAAEAVVLAAGLVPSLLWVGLGTGLALVVAQLGVTLARFRRCRNRVGSDADAVAAELGRLDPSYIFYLDSSVGMTGYVVNQWLPVFDLAPQAGFVMVRVSSELPMVLATHLPIVYAPTPRQVERLTLPTIRAAFYAGFALKNAQLMRNPALTHVMLNHGDSDKASSFNATASAYDELWVAGRAAVERYDSAGIHVSPERYALVGRPQVESLHVGPLNQEPRIILYAPTWEGYYNETDYTSLDRFGVELVTWLLRNHPEVRIWFKPHPASGRFRVAMLTAKLGVSNLLREAGNGHVLVDELGYTLNEAINRADVMVTDVSSVASDFLATRRPLVVSNPAGLSEAEFAARYPSLISAYRVEPGLATAAEVFSHALGDDPLADARRTAAEYILGDHPLGPQHTFNQALARVTS